MTAVTVVIDGIPIAKGRPRMTRRGITYTPKRTRQFEQIARLAAQAEMAGRPPLLGPVIVTVHAGMPIPRSWSQRRRLAAIVGDIRPTCRPDLDNLLKGALDALNGVVVADDAQIVAVTARKAYSPDPSMIVTVAPVDTARPVPQPAPLEQ